MLLAEFYKGAPDLVRFQEAWSPEHTYLDKLKVRLQPCSLGPMVQTTSQSLGEGRSQDLGGQVNPFANY